MSLSDWLKPAHGIFRGKSETPRATDEPPRATGEKDDKTAKVIEEGQKQKNVKRPSGFSLAKLGKFLLLAPLFALFITFVLMTGSQQPKAPEPSYHNKTSNTAQTTNTNTSRHTPPPVSQQGENWTDVLVKLKKVEDLRRNLHHLITQRQDPKKQHSKKNLTLLPVADDLLHLDEDFRFEVLRPLTPFPPLPDTPIAIELDAHFNNQIAVAPVLATTKTPLTFTPKGKTLSELLPLFTQSLAAQKQLLQQLQIQQPIQRQQVTPIMMPQPEPQPQPQPKSTPANKYDFFANSVHKHLQKPHYQRQAPQTDSRSPALLSDKPDSSTHELSGI